jgi:carbonic anhydrase
MKLESFDRTACRQQQKIEPTAACRGDSGWSRRRWLGIVGVGTALASMIRQAVSREVHAAQPAVNRQPDAVLARLLEGNKRFLTGKLEHPGRTPADFVPLAEGQAPLAIVVACADSRVAPELVFDQGVGDLFVVRVAGNIVTGAGASVKGSIEFAVAELGARLILVMGHSACGAVKAAVAHIDANDTLPGSIRELVEQIRPAATAVRGMAGDKVENAIKANVQKCVDTLKALDPIVAPLAKSGELKIVGGVYDLRTGQINLLG